MVGPPGARRTLSARAVEGILLHLAVEEAPDGTRAYSVQACCPLIPPFLGEAVRNTAPTCDGR